MLNWAQISDFIHANPALSAATAGMVLSTFYILLMVATRLGEVKPGIQAFVLSGVIHLVIVAMWGSLTFSGNLSSDGGGDSPGSDDELVVPISAVVVDSDERGSELGDQISGDPHGRGSSTVFNRIASPNKESFSRQQVVTSDRVVLGDPERTMGTMEDRQHSLPGLPQVSEVVDEVPEQTSIAEATTRKAADSSIDIGEETSESKSDTGISNSGAGQRTLEFGSKANESDASPVRTARQGQEFDPEVKVSVSSPSGVIEPPLVDTRDADAPSPVGNQITQRRTGAAPNSVAIEDPDQTTGQPDGGSDGGTSPTSSRNFKFSRVASSDMIGAKPSGNRGNADDSESKAGISRRVQEFASNTNSSTAPRIGVPTSGGGPSRDASVGKPGVATPHFQTVSPRRGTLTDTYKFRNPRQRKKVALKHGATQDSERAVELSLDWLARHQHPQGFWDADGYDAQCPTSDKCWGAAGRGNPSEVVRVNLPHDRMALETAGQHADTGLTALVVLTFLGAGYTHEEGQYSDQVDRALRWMVSQQEPNGYLGGKANHYEKMYCHGMATYALGEACGMMQNSEREAPKMHQALKRAVQYICSMQSPKNGGWRYVDGHLGSQECDMSMFGWQLMALKSAEIAGIPIPPETEEGMVRFLAKIASGRNKGLASYRLGEQPKASMTAEALFCRQVLGVKRDAPSSLEAIQFLSNFPPRPESQDLYYWYYGTLATYQYGGEPWSQWNDHLRDTLVQTQLKTGHAAGSWEPRDNWSRHGGRLYSTALSTLCLEVYYRFLPLYKSHDQQLDARPVSRQK